MPLTRPWSRTPLVSLVLSALAVVPSFAGSTDAAVRALVASGGTARVIMQYHSTGERDAAFNRLLDRGAAVRVADTEAGPALVVFGSVASFGDEASRASQVSLDAGVTVSAVRQPARGNWRPRERSASLVALDPARAGLAVAIIDSGVQPHADLPLARIRYFKDFATGSPVPVDGCGHGTHVAGIIAGDGRSSGGVYAGIAPGADIVALRVLGDDCSGNTSDVIDALEWIGRNHEVYRIKVVNLSLGHAVLESIFSDPLVQAVERLSRNAGVAGPAPGNKGLDARTNLPGYGGAGVPCNAPSAICVGSLDTRGSADLDDDRVAHSSSRGPTRFDLLAKPDLVAPGVGIVSLAAPGSRLYEEFEELRVAGERGGPDYFMLSGSSMAAPAVAAAAALLLQQNRALTANAIKLSLQFTARAVAETDVLTQGAGALNVGGALTLADAINPHVRRGANWIRHRITAGNVDANGRMIRWSQRIIYGDRFMAPHYAQVHLFRWDDDIVWAYDALRDDDNIVWGNAADPSTALGAGDNIVWGNADNIVWGNADNIAWRDSANDNIVWGNGIARGEWAARVVHGFWDDNIVWGNVTRDNADNIVWGNADPSTASGAGDNIVWGNDDAIVRGHPPVLH